MVRAGLVWDDLAKTRLEKGEREEQVAPAGLVALAGLAALGEQEEQEDMGAAMAPPLCDHQRQVGFFRIAAMNVGRKAEAEGTCRYSSLHSLRTIALIIVFPFSFQLLASILVTSRFFLRKLGSPRISILPFPLYTRSLLRFTAMAKDARSQSVAPPAGPVEENPYEKFHGSCRARWVLATAVPRHSHQHRQSQRLIRRQSRRLQQQ
ncbi:unnamed protein product [Closterium sp. NIES-64]|nr:unnamed protein product [Closterium sp. NIES-64]